MFEIRQITWQDTVTVGPVYLDEEDGFIDDDYLNVFVNGRYVFTIFTDSREFREIEPYLAEFDWKTPLKEFLQKQKQGEV